MRQNEYWSKSPVLLRMNYNNRRTQTESSTEMIEILLFSLGGEETFGLNVFKIREVTEMSQVTQIPGQEGAMNGVISLRGQVLPVVSLGNAIGMSTDQPDTKMIISEFASRSVAFAVTDVDKIIRVPWSDVKPPQRYDAEQGAVFGVVMLADGNLVSLVDIESVCHRVLPEKEATAVSTGFELNQVGPVFFVDDSLVARRKIGEVLDTMGLQHSHAVNGVEAEQKLLAMASSAESSHVAIQQRVSLVLVDEEMPIMDGCTLTRKLKGDPRFKNIPIIMYSSLTSEENARRGIDAGVNIYVKKFDSASLSNAIGQLLTHA
ncbi:two-component system chemotaxis response regulator CheV [Limnobacter thiooxidans]|uniref:Chemotaxis protein CheV n=2 Tax=Limnobacter thiooxidans TaxID=131080 RepID=A0AA86J1R7_9BURK|nr:two-component system chemotaxis response regulator CheV [Limnobacter thiooxidans]BET25314.1 chemotaxis protein CheV [Limnobacter thiooxidans]